MWSTSFTDPLPIELCPKGLVKNLLKVTNLGAYFAAEFSAAMSIGGKLSNLSSGPPLSLGGFHAWILYFLAKNTISVLSAFTSRLTDNAH